MKEGLHSHFNVERETVCITGHSIFDDSMDNVEIFLSIWIPPSLRIVFEGSLYKH